MLWFTKTAPIRTKMKIAFAGMTLLVALAVLVALGAAAAGYPLAGLAGGILVTIAAAVAGAWIRRAICDPYVSTVVRMEGLAAGDLDSPIQFTDYTDCVGRMTKAMFTFRANAATMTAQSIAQDDLVSVLTTHLSSLRDGDLTSTIMVEFPPEYAAVKAYFNEAIESMRELIGAVSESASLIRVGSGEIARAAEDLARRTESTSASLEETSTSVSEMDGRLKASVDSATLTVERADQAIVTVGGGRAVADEAVQAMGRVSESAKGIDSVIEGLDKIAFQTRVLAMNAAVEAGRAGDAGRGFAVVADLVSALAMRAEEEAKRARDQLTVTQTEIVTAVEAVTKVDGALANISGDVTQVHALLATMSVDNQAQSAAITQISSAIDSMDQSTQQNAAMVEQASAAARSLASEVDDLAEKAGHFKLASGPQARRGAAGATASPTVGPKAGRRPVFA